MIFLKVYSATLKDVDKEVIVQPFISTDDDSAVTTVRNAIREDKNILAMAMSERIKLYWICDIDPENFTVKNYTDNLCNVKDEIYFRKYAQQIYAEKQKMEANEAEADVKTDAEKGEVVSD